MIQILGALIHAPFVVLMVALVCFMAGAAWMSERGNR